MTIEVSRAASLLPRRTKARKRASTVWKGIVGVMPINAPIATPRARTLGSPRKRMNRR